MGRRKNKKRKRMKTQALERVTTPPPPKGRSLWRRIPGWLKATAGCLTILITLLEGWPWLSVEENGMLDSRNPYSTLFLVVNNGYARITDLDADCTLDFEDTSHNKVENVHALRPSFADYLSHSGRATIPCFNAVEIGQQSFLTAKLEVVITYSFYPVTFNLFRRHQTFSFTGIRSPDGPVHWAYVNKHD
jgi:hypothetical protein